MKFDIHNCVDGNYSEEHKSCEVNHRLLFFNPDDGLEVKLTLAIWIGEKKTT